MIRLITAFFIVTAYCDSSCDKAPEHPAYGIMANGEETHQGAIACPSWMPLGTRVYLKGVGGVTCKDRGGGMKNGIDLWFPTCEEAMEWGRREIRGAVIVPGRGPR